MALDNGHATQSRHQSKSLRDLLLTHQLIFISLILIAALGGAYSIFLWDKAAKESQRIHLLVQEIQQTRGDLYRQMKELFDAYFLNDQDASHEYEVYSQSILSHFAQLELLAAGKSEKNAINELKKNYDIFRKAAPGLFERYQLSPNEESRKMIYLDMETGIFTNYEQVSKRAEILLSVKQLELKERLSDAKLFSLLILSIPIMLAGLLLILSRRLLKREIVQPIQAIMDATVEISDGKLQYRVPITGATELAKLANEINKMADDLADSRDALVRSEKQAALGLLVPMLAHNIRNPLSSIRATAQMIDIPNDNPDTKESVIAIINTVDRLERWTGGLLAYLHPVKPTLTLVKIEDVIQNAIGPLNLKLQEKKITLVKQFNLVQTQTYTDEHLLEQLIYNLSLNAIDASPKNSTIVIETLLNAQFLRITLTDEGSGMPFKPDPHASSPGPTTKRFGTGLGIPFAFKVCEVLAGEIQFSERQPTGTIVTLLFNQHMT